MALAPGTVVGGDFRIEHELSRGGMGHVYVATQLSTGRERAFKVMRAELVQDPRLRRRFEQEAKVGATIQSDHVVEVIAAGVDEATAMPWLAMELLEGQSLADLVDRKGALAPEEAGQVLGHVAHALGAAHAVGVVHRDLKPENVFVARARRAGEALLVKVLDFGIAKVVAEARSSATAPVGTLLWMAPEQADSDGAIGPATDVWSFGLLAFFVLTGQPFWHPASPAVLMKKLVVEPIPAASERANEVGRAARLPVGFDAWFAACLARDPASRTASIVTANEDLQRMLGESLALARTELRPAPAGSAVIAEPDAPSGSGRKLVAAGAAIAVVAAVVFGLARAAGTAPGPSASAPSAAAAPNASSSAGRFALSPDDTDDHDTIWRVPLEDSPRRGGKEPLLTIVEFADFECPFARAFEDKTKRILDTYGDDVAIVWKDLIVDLHPIAEPAARLARLARADLGDDAFWRAHDRLFAACRENDLAEVITVGRELGLPADKVEAALDAPAEPAIERDNALAIRLGRVGTPTSFFNGRNVNGNRPFDELRPLIEAELAHARRLLAAGVPRASLYDEMQKGAKDLAPRVRHPAEVHDDGPVLAGAHAVIDVHQFGDETSFYEFLYQPVVESILREFGEKIRFHWHWVPDPSNDTALRVAAASEAIYSSNGNEVFWAFHRKLVQNVQFPFAFKSASATPPRGFDDAALKDYAHDAGANLLHVEGMQAKVKSEHWDATRATLRRLGDDGAGHTLFAGGYVFGASLREARQILGELIAEAEGAKKP